MNSALNVKFLSESALTINNNSELNPWFITDLMDGDGTFHYSIVPKSDNKVGYSVIYTCAIVAKDTPMNRD
jgi:hypothetical protein